ncbi:probable calcium-binding protein CML46 [Typha latifolia]|uniref:probable calcium-binding protein CML46 n=1 Tax=Typha latifolia TaxID=4733 RepID=UPI003C2DC090
MEKASSESTSALSLSLTEAIVIFFYNASFIWVFILQKFSARVFSLLHCHGEFHTSISRVQAETQSSRNGKGEVELTREDVEMVMERMGMSQGLETEQHKARVTFDELSTMFEEKEPSLGEVKEAFSVFDQNSDGFIDAMELQRILSNLGFREGLALEESKRMIAAYDENKDGRIDFSEFVRLMESSFC